MRVRTVILDRLGNFDTNYTYSTSLWWAVRNMGIVTPHFLQESPFVINLRSDALDIFPVYGLLRRKRFVMEQVLLPLKLNAQLSDPLSQPPTFIYWFWHRLFALS